MDIATHVVRRRKLGIPQSGRDVFALLEQAGLLPTKLADSLKSMVGFRNVSVHNYTDLDLDIVEAVIDEHLDDFTAFANLMLEAEKKE